MLNSNQTLYEFPKEGAPLNVTFRIVNPKASYARIKESSFELSKAFIFKLKLVKPIKLKVDVQLQTSFFYPESVHIYNTFVFIR